MNDGYLDVYFNFGGFSFSFQLMKKRYCVSSSTLAGGVNVAYSYEEAKFIAEGI